MLNCTGFTGSNSISRSPDFSIASDETRDEHVKIAEITRRLEEDSDCVDKESDVSSVLITGKDQSISKRKDENSDKTQGVNDDDSNTDKSTAIIPLKITITTDEANVNSETVTPVSQEKLRKETKQQESGSTKDSQETMFLTLNPEQRYMTNKSSMQLLLV